MADFSTPFGENGEKRLPTSNERSSGFPCGPADQRLFNGMFNRIEAELGEVINFAGIQQTDDRNTLLREAIEAIISAATGGGDLSQFFLVSQARSRLPIFPEIVSADNKINVSSPAAGTIRIPSGVNFLHRGVYTETTVETDFTTVANKTYHVRWGYGTGYIMEDLSDTNYNPDTLPEYDKNFDSTYDNMLISRVVTNSSNSSTITNLANASSFSKIESFQLSTERSTSNWTELANSSISLNWARTPEAFPAFQYVKGTASETGTIGNQASGYTSHNIIRAGIKVQTDGINRYLLKNVLHQYEDSSGDYGWINFVWNARA